MKLNHLKLIIFFVIFFVLFTNNLTAQYITKNKKKNTTEISLNLIPSKYYDTNIQNILDKINETILKNYLIDLCLIGPRMTSTYGCDKAAEYIYKQFTDMGLDTRYQNWESFGDRYHFKYFKAKNIEAIHYGKNPDTDEVLIFNAHYDTVKNTVGANDDGSGTVAVLTAAYILSQYQFNRTIKFLTFSGEEIGLRGSRAYANEIYKEDTKILVEFNADMIGKATTKETGRKMGLSYTNDAEWVIDIFENITNDYNMYFNFNRHQINPEDRGYSDYYYFSQLGYETIACWQGEGDPNMHKPSDDLNNVNFSYLVNTTKHIVCMLATLANMELEQPQIRLLNPKHGKLFFEDRTIIDLKYENTIVIDNVLLLAEVTPGKNPIEKVEFIYDGKLLFTDKEPPYFYRLNEFSMKKHTIKVNAYDTAGNKVSDEIKFFFWNVLKKH